MPSPPLGEPSLGSNFSTVRQRPSMNFSFPISAAGLDLAATLGLAAEAPDGCGIACPNANEATDSKARVTERHIPPMFTSCVGGETGYWQLFSHVRPAVVRASSPSQI